MLLGEMRYNGIERRFEIGRSDCMKTVLLGIALILFGFNLTYVSVQASWAVIDVIGLCISFIGFIVSLVGGLSRDK